MNSYTMKFVITIALVLSAFGTTIKNDNLSEAVQDVKKYMNVNVDPCVDFYEYSCGNWKVIHPLKMEQLITSTITDQTSKMESLMREILEDPAINPEHTESERKAKKFYMSCINVPNRREELIKQYKTVIESVGGWPALDSNWNSDNFDWLNLTAQVQIYGGIGLMDVKLWSFPPHSVRLQLIEADLVLRREYFQNPFYNTILLGYKTKLIKIMKEFGASENMAKQVAKEVIELEKNLTDIIVDGNVNPQFLTLQSLKLRIPKIDWTKYFTILFGASIPDDQAIILSHVNFFESLVDVLSATDGRIIANFLMWRLVVLQTIKETGNQAKWKDCLKDVKESMDMAVGAMFIRKHYDEGLESDIKPLVDDIRKSFMDDFEKNTWLDGQTKTEMKEKQAALSLKIGYSKNIFENNTLDNRYKDLDVQLTTYGTNLFNSKRYTLKLMHSKLISKEVEDFEVKLMNEVNILYSYKSNAMGLPAPLLQPPMYSKNLPKSIIYGKFGTLIGHELAHSFDSIGRYVTANGEFRLWWSENSIQELKRQSECFISQYGNLRISEVNSTVDGKMTLDENIGDNAGLRHAFRAYENWLSRADKKDLDHETNIPEMSLTNKQLFFVGFAQFFCSELTPFWLRHALRVDKHGLSKYRVLGTVSNSKEFSKEFNCTSGAAMNPDIKCKLW